ncbi:hypothetical protein M885DRAFT_509871 [Pelagophyceae sp. CCMP2097]|nr:hypothetical protein M885DRAFT_509871 [Pelagophyceae sp. CCMP2097]
MMPSAPARAVAFCKFCASRPQLCVVVLAVVIRSNALLNGVVWDDRAAVTLNKDVNTTLTPSGNVWRDDYWGQSMALPDSHKSWRPLSTLSFRANFAVHSYRPGGYHFVNVMLHAWACAMVLKVANLVLDDSGLVAAALFAVHPVHTEAVASIVGRADVLCGALTLTAVYAHLRAAAAARRSRGLAWGFAAYACAGSASLAKEIGISSFGLFFALAVIDAVCKKKSRRSLVAGAAACGLATLGAAAMFLLHTARHGETLVYSWTVLENSVALEPRFLDRAMSYAHLHALYAAKLVWPLRLCYDYGWPCVAHVTSVGDARNAASLGLYAGVAVVVAVAVRGRSTAALRCVALTVVPFLPASQVALPVGTLLGERLLYLPSAGLCIAVAGLFRAVDVRTFAPGAAGPARQRGIRSVVRGRA